MNWTEVKIKTSQEEIDILCNTLLDLGILGLNINDPKDFEELVNNNYGNWDYIDESLTPMFESEPNVTFYLPDNGQGIEMLKLIQSQIKSDIIVSTINEEDWANNWKQYFKPFLVGDRLVVKPSWEKYSLDKYKNLPNQIVLEIDPASSFGTGQHQTTKLCLELLEKYINPQNNTGKILDIGCGSGILSIAGLLLGAEIATAVDIDQNSVKTAKENAAKNNIFEDRYNTFCGNILADKDILAKIGVGFDIITANIVADVIIDMADLFHGLIVENGVVILSGIIEERFLGVNSAMENAGFGLKEKREDGGWVAAVY